LALKKDGEGMSQVLSCSEFDSAARENAKLLISLAFEEDLGTSGDITSQATIPEDARCTALLVSRAPGILAGLPILEMIAARFGVNLDGVGGIHDGAMVQLGTEIAKLSGATRQVLMIERTALNFLQRMSGVATLAAHFVAAVKGTNAVIVDTRKTTPGWRALEKYAVRCGGGHNHRFGLFDDVLIKDNHLAGLAPGTDIIGRAVGAAREKAPRGTTIEVEVDSLEQLNRALACAPDSVLLDNFGLNELIEAVRTRNQRAPRILLEASGGVTLETVGAIAQTGVDRISVGALTHSAPALDLALDFQMARDP
jgi:nicotinate-nucleotide pyrophosphorylase (carboxylating)